MVSVTGPRRPTRHPLSGFPTVWVEVAKSAVDTLLELTADARAVASWYEENSGRAWLPGADLGPKQAYTATEIGSMFGFISPSSGSDWLKREKVSITRSGGRIIVARGDVEEVLLSKWERLDYLTRDRRCLRRFQHLFLTFAFFHKAKISYNPCVLAMTTDQHISDFLSGRGSGLTRIPSIFERFGSKMADGSAMRITTHQFRHWLITILQRGGLGQHLVARWSGRKEISQNGEYDHMSGVELGENARNLIRERQGAGYLSGCPRTA